MNHREILQTQRLVIRCLQLKDAPFVLELLNSPGWLQYIGDRQVKTIVQAKTYLRDGPLSSYKKFGFGLYHVGLKNSGMSLGMCGLIQRDGMDGVEIGFAFLPGQMGKGYGLEASEAVIDFAKHRLKIQHLRAITLPENKNSIRLLEKNGLRFEKKIRLPGEAEELMVFARHL